jgi:diacylglycerol kinase (ATP)
VLEDLLKNGDFQALIAFGGDGLVSLCVQIISQTSIGFCVIPTGTGNDFARSIGTYRESIDKVFDILVKNKPIKMDVAVADHGGDKRYFVQILSSGFDASVNELANQIKLPIGRIKYTLSMLLRLPRFKAVEFEITADSKKIKVKSMLVVVANGSTYGGGMRILPDASFHDGRLDLLYVDPVSKLTLLSIFPLVFKGWHLKHPAVHVISARNISIKGNTNAYADGEYVSNLPLKISIIRDGLSAWVYK